MKVPEANLKPAGSEFRTVGAATEKARVAAELDRQLDRGGVFPLKLLPVIATFYSRYSYSLSLKGKLVPL